jgi:hypothetical protein
MQAARVAELQRRAIRSARSLAADSAIAWGVVAGLWVCGAALLLTHPLNHDVGWLLTAAREFVSGSHPYADSFVDVNPPGFLLLMAPVIWLTEVADLPTVLVFRIALLLVVTFALAVSWSTLRSLLEDAPAAAVIWSLSAIALVVLVWPAARQDVRFVHFGQREHAIVVGLIPYFLALACRLGDREISRATAILAGSSAALAVCLKPHYALAVAGLELGLAIARRSPRILWRPETAAGALIVVGFGAAPVLALPGYLDLAVPLGLQSYWAYQDPLEGLVSLAHLGWGLVALGAFATARRVSWLRDLAAMQLLAAVCFYAAYLSGGTRWAYHLLPFESAVVWLVLTASAGLAIHEAVPASSTPLRGRLVRSVAAAVCICVGVALLPRGIGATLREGLVRLGGPTGQPADLARIMRRHAPGGVVTFFTTSVYPAFPAVNYADVDWGSRFSCLWPLPALHRTREAIRMGAIDVDASVLDENEDYLLDAVVEDITRRRPDLIFVDEATDQQAMGGLEVDYLGYFGSDPRFQARWSAYRLLGVVGRYRVFTRAAAGSGR